MDGVAGRKCDSASSPGRGLSPVAGAWRSRCRTLGPDDCGDKEGRRESGRRVFMSTGHSRARSQAGSR